MYQVFLGLVPLPVPPSKINTTVGSRNTTIDLIDGREVSILKGKGLTKISFEFLLPHQSYPFASVKTGSATSVATNTAILKYLEKLKTYKQPVQLVIVRTGPKGLLNLYNATIKVTLEDFSVSEDAGEHGLDFLVSVNFKEYQTYSTKIVDAKGNVTKVRP